MRRRRAWTRCARSSAERARRASFRSPSRGWSRCTRSFPRRRSGRSCRGCRRRAGRRCWSCPSSGWPREGNSRVTIVEDVRARGDEAVREWALELDGVEPTRAVPEPERLPREAVLALADRVRRWHEAQRPRDVELEVEPGVLLQRRWVPLATVGIYVPRNL